MTTGILTCPECRAPVPHGRLSCAECGSVLAAVSGASRGHTRFPPGDPPVVQAPAPTSAPVPDPEARPAPLDGASAAMAPPDRAAARVAEPPAVERPVPSVLRPWDAPAPAPALDPDPGPGSEHRRVWGRGPADPAVSPLDPAPVTRPVPGAYLPPAVTYRPGVGAVETGVGQAGGPVAAESATWGLPAPVTADAVAAPSPERLPAGRTPARLADASVEVPSDAPGWMAMAGSLLGALSFFLPWSPRVLGSTGGGGYLDRWGLANPANLLLLLALVATLAIIVVPNRLPAWFRFGALPLVVGGVHLGVAWLHLSVSYGYLVGMPILLVAALVLVAGGAIGVRHAVQPPVV